MESSQKKAISAVAVVSIILISIIGIYVVFIAYRDTYTCPCYGATQVFPEVDSVNFTSKNNTFNFKLSTPYNFNATTLTTVTLNDTVCSGNFPPITKSVTIPLSCVLTQQVIFRAGQTLIYILKFADGESLTGALIAQ
jgi:hypothetical protein